AFGRVLCIHGELMDTHRVAARMGSALPSLVRWGLSPDADLVYRTLVSLDTAREGQLAHDLGMSHERVRDAMRELAGACADRRGGSTPRRAPKATGRAVWAARQPSQVVRQLHVHRTRHLALVASVELAPQPFAATGSQPFTRPTPQPFTRPISPPITPTTPTETIPMTATPRPTPPQAPTSRPVSLDDRAADHGYLSR